MNAATTLAFIVLVLFPSSSDASDWHRSEPIESSVVYKSTKLLGVAPDYERIIITTLLKPAGYQQQVVSGIQVCFDNKCVNVPAEIVDALKEHALNPGERIQYWPHGIRTEAADVYMYGSPGRLAVSFGGSGKNVPVTLVFNDKDMSLIDVVDSNQDSVKSLKKFMPVHWKEKEPIK